MVEDSLGYMLSKYPYFLNKSETSNLYKIADVNNSVFRQLYNSLFDVYQGFHLNKRILIWKEQTEYYNYTMRFVANFDNMKSVKCYKFPSFSLFTDLEDFNNKKEDYLIHSVEYPYIEEKYDVTIEYPSFDYSYEYNIEENNINIEDLEIIPQDKFYIEVETWDEFEIFKGFPENDVNVTNSKNVAFFFNHDETLDHLGALNNIPRRELIKISNPDDYSLTLPPYNDRLSEDDYHYMKRMIEYNVRLYINPPPVLEVWKTYNVDSTLVNREKILLKLFDINKHNHEYQEDSLGDKLFVTDWGDEEKFANGDYWLHKDKFCDYLRDTGVFFFAKPSTNYPLKNKEFTLKFKSLDMFGDPVDFDFNVSVDWVMGDMITNIFSNVSDREVTILPKYISQDAERNLYQITFYDADGEVVGRDKVAINVRGCDTANYFVSVNGDDSNDGKTVNTPFRSIQKALDSVYSDNNVIVVMSGKYDISSPLVVYNSCTILACGENVTINNTVNPVFFTLNKGVSLVLSDLNLAYLDSYLVYVGESSFTNDNLSLQFNIILMTDEAGPVLTIIVSPSVSNYFVGDEFSISGVLKNISGDIIDIDDNNALTVNYYNTDYSLSVSDGSFSHNVTPSKVGDLVLIYTFDDGNYVPSVRKVTLSVTKRLSDLLSDYTYVVSNVEYVDGEWNYDTIPVSEIVKMSDLNNCIKNLTYSDTGDVTYERLIITSPRTTLNKSNLRSLKGLLVGLEYDNGEVFYEALQLLGETVLTVTLLQDYYIMGDNVTFKGKLTTLDGKNIKGEKVVVNGEVYTTNNKGEFTGSASSSSYTNEFILNATFEGNDEYDTVTTTLPVNLLPNVTALLSDYERIIMDMDYTDGLLRYDTKLVSQINTLSDLDGAIMNLNYTNGVLSFERFDSNGQSSLSGSELTSLNGLLFDLEYVDGSINMEMLNI